MENSAAISMQCTNVANTTHKCAVTFMGQVTPLIALQAVETDTTSELAPCAVNIIQATSRDTQVPVMTPNAVAFLHVVLGHSS